MQTQAAIDPQRLASITTLKSGSHREQQNAYCVMEAVAYVAGDPWSDHPPCARPVLTAFMVAWNDGLPSDEERNRLLLPLVPRLVGTRGDRALEARRATMAADWYIRVQTPAWLRLIGLNDHADALASFPEITSFEKTPSIMAPLEAARSAASAAESAAWSAAESAAESAAWSAAESALEKTKIELQQSALDLVERMIAAQPQEAPAKAKRTRKAA